MARTLPIALLIALLAVAATAPAAHARPHSGRCTGEAGSPRCHYWYGKAVFFADGDTIDVNIAGDGHGARHIRFSGINAMELTRYSSIRSRRRGECHAVAATNRVEALIRRGHRRVRLAAQHASSRSGHRLRRQVSTKINGRWVDVNRAIIAEGRALFLGNSAEWAWDRPYMRLAQRAAARRLRLWNPRGCGAGPQRHVTPRVRIKYDADGYDKQNTNGEWARIFNPSSRRLRLGPWGFRGPRAARLPFPRGTSVPAHGSVLRRMGHGPNRHGVFHWGLSGPPFENPNPATGSGDGGYLFDPRGNLRAWTMYPCLVGCGSQ